MRALLAAGARAGTLIASMTSSHMTDEPAGARVFERRLERFRALRRELEGAVLPLATSIDGRRFSFQASLHGLELRLGGFVVIEQEGRDRLGQVLALELDQRDGTGLPSPSAGTGRPSCISSSARTRAPSSSSTCASLNTRRACASTLSASSWKRSDVMGSFRLSASSRFSSSMASIS